MTDKRPEPPFERTVCACPECVSCCQTRPGSLAVGDMERIAEFLGEPVEEAKRHFVASPGALLLSMLTLEKIRVGGITPASTNGRCTFLDEQDRCRIHQVSPAGCAYFDMHMGWEDGSSRSMWLARGQMSREYQALRDTLPQSPLWSGPPDPSDPDNFWIDEGTNERVNAATGERTPR